MKDIILLHGALGSVSSLNRVKSALEGRFNCHSLNLSGHGQTAFNPSGFGIERFAEELAEFIEEHKLVRPHIFGFSMGGYVALYLASQNPDLLGKIITLGTKFAWTRESAAHETSRMIPEVMEKKIPAYTDKLERIHGLQWKSLVSKTASMMKGLGEKPLLNKERLEVIENEVLILRGSVDGMVSEEESLWASTNLEKGKFETLTDQPHPIEKVDLSILTKAMINFL